jgi:hypothetical protein
MKKMFLKILLFSGFVGIVSAWGDLTTGFVDVQIVKNPEGDNTYTILYKSHNHGNSDSCSQKNDSLVAKLVAPIISDSTNI